MAFFFSFFFILLRICGHFTDVINMYGTREVSDTALLELSGTTGESSGRQWELWVSSNRQKQQISNKSPKIYSPQVDVIYFVIYFYAQKHVTHFKMVTGKKNVVFPQLFVVLVVCVCVRACVRVCVRTCVCVCDVCVCV